MCRFLLSPWFAIVCMTLSTLFFLSVDTGNISELHRNKVRMKHSKPMLRILCYGDSLTAGTSPPLQGIYPYAPYLQSALNFDEEVSPLSSPAVRKEGTNLASTNHHHLDYHYSVRHRGNVGWSSSMMMDYYNDTVGGIEPALQSSQDGNPSIVIIMTGTNDVGLDNDPYEIAKSIVSLHLIALRSRYVKKTIAVGIPPSAHQQYNKAAFRVAHRTNGYVEEFTNDKKQPSYGKILYVPFPFHYSKDEEKLKNSIGKKDYSGKGTKWATDGIHCSRSGYQILGESLAPVVRSIVDSRQFMN